jgi:serine/threonine protein kinase
VVPVEEAFLVGSFRAVVMPYLGGVTLAHILKSLTALPQPPIWGRALFAAQRPDLPPGAPVPADAGLRTALESVSFADAVLWIGMQVAAGLAHAHRQGVLHLDLKPANVLWTDAGRPMLLDFHLAAAAGRGEPAGGTLPYMAPEQIDAFRGTGRVVDGRADLFGLGVILFQFFTGKLPFPTDRDTTPEGLAAALEDRLKPLSDVRELNPAAPPAGAAVVARLLAPDPERRYRSARALIGDLRQHLRRTPLPLPGWWVRWFGG